MNEIDLSVGMNDFNYGLVSFHVWKEGSRLFAAKPSVPREKIVRLSLQLISF